VERSIRLAIEGMHCGGCVTRVANALRNVPGVAVRSVEVGSAAVAFDAARVSGAEVLEAVIRLGFQAREAPPE